ncbi:MAG: NAD(P)-dependent glycerol-3-phosphate dehydrogenase [Alphaproteobacteria bacterium]|nr:NAD(P)-dependent glycerol-3-phosphate dehydrogenase [Alphaproteobacteria bacterium]
MRALREIGVAGGGAWGSALAHVAAASGPVRLWLRSADLAETIGRTHENPTYLPGIRLHDAIAASADPAALAGLPAILLAVPTQFLRATAEALAPHLAADALIVVCAKGIERTSGRLAGEVAREALPGRPLAILSGPTFAEEVARGLPAAVTLAAADAMLARALADRLGQPAFRPYLSDDMTGAEVGGAVKNVLAIACGIVQGRGLGENARAALITRGMAEMLRLGLALGARAETLMGLSGLGDLVLTCTGAKSRNMTLGRALGEGQRLDAILAARRSVAEGVATAPALAALAGRLGIEMPIAGAVDAILHRGASIDGAIAALLARPLREENPLV